MRQTIFLASLLLAIVVGQQYNNFPVYLNQSRPGNWSWPPKFNYSDNYGNKYNFSNNYGNKFNYSNKYNYSSYRPINQFPNYPQFNFSRYVAYNTTSNGTREGHLFLGQIQLYDRLLFSHIYRKESRWWTYRDAIIDYPSAAASGYVASNTRISAIRCYNQFWDGNTARASIRKGGPGYSYVQIYLESNWNKGFQFSIDIYGRQL